MKKCPKCGTECTDDLKTCSECGNSLDVTQEPKRKNIFKILKEKKQLIKTIFIIRCYSYFNYKCFVYMARI